MSELTATTPLQGFARTFDGITLSEVAGLALMSVALPRGGRSAAADALRSHVSVEWPKVGMSTRAPVTGERFLGLQHDQIFVMATDADGSALPVLAEKLGTAFYLSDQSDSWAVLQISGPRCRAALERLCPIDVAPEAFPVGAVTRTIMEHHGAIILRTDADAFLLLSPRSSAMSFLHTIVQAVESTANAV